MRDLDIGGFERTDAQAAFQIQCLQGGKVERLFRLGLLALAFLRLGFGGLFRQIGVGVELVDLQVVADVVAALRPVSPAGRAAAEEIAEGLAILEGK